MSQVKVMKTAGVSAGWAFVLVSALMLALTGCDQHDNRTAGEKVDAAIAKTERAADQAASKTGEAVKEAKAKLESSDTGAQVSQAAKDAGNAIADATSDASITAAVTAGLAKDPDLSAIKISVDTKQGNVTLRGPAPNTAAKERAAQIAKAVKGVNTVDNELEVKAM